MKNIRLNDAQKLMENFSLSISIFLGGKSKSMVNGWWIDRENYRLKSVIDNKIENEDKQKRFAVRKTLNNKISVEKTKLCDFMSAEKIA